jgi:hypothetical protein
MIKTVASNSIKENAAEWGTGSNCTRFESASERRKSFCPRVMPFLYRKSAPVAMGT